MVCAIKVMKGTLGLYRREAGIIMTIVEDLDLAYKSNENILAKPKALFLREIL